MYCSKDIVWYIQAFTKLIRPNDQIPAHPRCKNLQHLKNKENKEFNIIIPNPNKSHRTKKNFTGYYTEVNRKFH